MAFFKSGQIRFRFIEASDPFGDLGLPGAYITDLMLEPTEANKPIIAAAIGKKPEQIETYVQIQIDRNRVFLFNLIVVHPNQYLYPFRPLPHSPPNIIFEEIP